MTLSNQSDLTKRLRDDRHIWYDRPLDDGELRIWHLLCCEAADEIDRLNAALDQKDFKSISFDGLDKSIDDLKDLVKVQA